MQERLPVNPGAPLLHMLRAGSSAGYSMHSDALHMIVTGTAKDIFQLQPSLARLCRHSPT